MPFSQQHEPTFLWYDYETWGAQPARDRIAQFAGIRTDLNLNPIGEPINLFCKPMMDTVIDPVAVTITGLSPLKLAQHGLSEFEFAKAVEHHMSVPNTCSVGYNSIRFDDECTRYLLYRNLRDPYAREWQNGNSRWDLLDVVRMTKALRPEGITWPVHENGAPSFKLEQLTVANGIGHEHAHDAVSDVKATIALAKLIQTAQPKLFSYAFGLRSKHEVMRVLNVNDPKPHLHFTGKVPALEHCMGIELPLMVHPKRKNEVIVIDIREDPSWLLGHSAKQLNDWLYTKTDDLPEGQKRVPFKTIHINKSPMIAPLTTLDDEAQERLNVDENRIKAHAEKVQTNPAFNALALAIFDEARDFSSDKPQDPEHALYGGFIDRHDRNILNGLLAEPEHKQAIAKQHWLAEVLHCHDDRLPELVESVLARHFPEVLTESELKAWHEKRRQVLMDSDRGQALTFEQAIQATQNLLKEDHENLALKETLTYLEERQAYWFGDSLSKTQRLESNSAPINAEKPQSDESPIAKTEQNHAPQADKIDENEPTQQIDLF